MYDAADPAAGHQLQTVEKTLDDIGAIDQPRILVLNKIDCVKELAERLVLTSMYPEAVQLSAKTREGVEALDNEVRSFVVGPMCEVTLSLETSAGKAIDFIEKRTTVLHRDWKQDRSMFRVKIGQRQLQQLASLGGKLLVNDMKPVEAFEVLWPSEQKQGGCC